MLSLVVILIFCELSPEASAVDMVSSV
jgi:hypothetical protein